MLSILLLCTSDKTFQLIKSLYNEGANLLNMTHKTKSTVLVFAFILCFFAGGLGGWALSDLQNPPSEEVQDTSSGQVIEVPEGINLEGADFTVFWEVWALMEANYLHEEAIDPQLLVEGAIEGLVDSLEDPYSYYTRPEYVELDDLSESYEGVGAQLEMNDKDQIVIVSPIKGSPAETAGLRPGDIIVAVNGEDVYGKSLDVVVTTIRGEEGTEVTLTIYREGETETFDITITRSVIETPSVEYSINEVNGEMIALVHINQFTVDTGEKFMEAVEAIQAEEVRGLILDLRFNPGGYISPIPEILAPFFSEDESDLLAFTLEGRNEIHNYSSYIDPTGELADLPVVILINEGTASASEILTGALQDYDRVTVVGTQSYGKGITQMVFDLSDGSRVQLTDTEWFTPDHRNIHEIGITPDIIVDMDPADAYSEVDVQMDRAEEILLSL